MMETGGEEQSILRSEDLARRLAHNRLAPEGGGVVEEVLKKSNKTGQTFC
jgi:hypothetical protein